MQKQSKNMLVGAAITNFVVGSVVPKVTIVSMFVKPFIIAGIAALIATIVVEAKDIDSQRANDVVNAVFAGLFLGTSLSFGFLTIYRAFVMYPNLFFGL